MKKNEDPLAFSSFILTIITFPIALISVFLLLFKNTMCVFEETSPRQEITQAQDPVKQKIENSHKTVSSEQVVHKIKTELGDMFIERPLIKIDEGYDDLLEDTVYKFKNKSENDIWAHTFTHIDWFVDEFYAERANEALIKEKIGTYLIPSDEVLGTYKDALIFDVIYLLEQGIGKTSGASGELISPISEADLRAMLEGLIPNNQEMTESVYRQLEIKGQNQTYKITALESWKQYQLDRPNTLLTYEVFALALITLSNAPVFTVIAVGTAISIERSIAHTHQQEKIAYKDALRSELFKKKALFDHQVKYFIETIFEGVKKYREGKSQPAQINLKR